ncbi:MMPL family transporter, partial [Desulfobacterales bacterium HSG16]|nr:MMPL family transporter [Desulfobacterales bacterium HSG16]
LVPIFLSFMPRPDIWKHGRSFIVQDIIDLILNKTASLTIRLPRTMVVIFCLIFIIASYGFSQIRFETQFSKRFDENNIVQVSKRYFEHHFPGTNPLDIYIESPEKQGLLNPELFAEIAKFETWIESLDSVKQAVSVVDLVKKMYQEIAPEQAKANPLPVTREALAQLLLLFEMSGGENLDRMIDYEYKITRLNVRLPDMGVIETSQIGKRIAEHGKKLFDGAAIVESLSMDYLLGDWVDDVLKGQRTGLLFAMMTVAILMIISMRSFHIGLISMFPNLLPLLVLLGYMGLCWDVVDTDTLGILMIAIGIGVDDTVHFLMRLRFEFEKTHDVEHAIRQTFHYSGRAIFITSVILVAGFAPFAMSEYFSLHIFGTLLPACLVVALAADLLLVPAL